MNKLYGMLAPEAVDYEPYYRHSLQPRVYLSELDLLVPGTTEDAYKQFCANQLCALVLNNALSSFLADLDPENTYSRLTETVEEEETTISGLPETVTISVADMDYWHTWVDKEIKLQFDGVTTVTYGPNKSVEWEATGTTPMNIDGIVIMFNGPVPASSFNVTVLLVRKPARNLVDLLARLDAADIVWSTKLEPYKDSTMPSTRLVAYVLNALSKI